MFQDRLTRESSEIQKKKLDTVTHREKNLSYQTENDTEKKQWESHVKEAILKCYRRKYIIKFSYTLVASILTNEREKFPHFGWLRNLGFKPCFIIPVKQTRWTHKPLKTETKTVQYQGSNYEMLRKEYSNFVTYYRTKSWMNTPLHEWEMSRLSDYLKKKFPNTKFSLMLDNVASHSNIQFQNLKVAFLPPNSTASLQPLDTSIFGTMKNKYASWLMRETLEKGPENLKLEDCVRSFADVFWNMDVRSVE